MAASNTQKNAKTKNMATTAKGISGQRHFVRVSFFRMVV
jgi:hypothetical protein